MVESEDVAWPVRLPNIRHTAWGVDAWFPEGQAVPQNKEDRGEPDKLTFLSQDYPSISSSSLGDDCLKDEVVLFLFLF